MLDPEDQAALDDYAEAVRALNPAPATDLLDWTGRWPPTLAITAAAKGATVGKTTESFDAGNVRFLADDHKLEIMIFVGDPATLETRTISDLDDVAALGGLLSRLRGRMVRPRPLPDALPVEGMTLEDG